MTMPLFTLLAVALLGVAATSCGGTSKDLGAASQSSSGRSTLGDTLTTTTSSGTSTVSTPPTTTTATAGGRPKDFNDGDADPNGDDDNVVLDYGRPARPAEKQEITTVAKHYYEAAVAENGAKGCALMHAVIAESLATNTEPGSPASGSTTCAATMSKLFAQRHQQYVASLGSAVTGVRVDGEIALVLLSSRTTPIPHSIKLHREGSAWKMWDLFDRGLP